MHSHRRLAIRIVKKLRHSNFEAVFAGGCVRDHLLGLEPKDYDIATNATPTEILKLFPNSRDVGAHFGVILTHLESIPFEIATFRTDSTYKDGRRPESVAFTNAEEDARRRDFTVNGLFEDPIENKIIDYVSGLPDLHHRILRCIGNPDQRFSEDYLRLLRAVRLATTLENFSIHEGTWGALCNNASKASQMAAERIREELNKTLAHPQRLKGFDLLVSSGLMDAILPEITRLKGCEQPPEWHPEGDVFVHTRLMLSMLAPDAPLKLVWATLLHDIAKPDTRSVDPESGRIRFNGHDKLGAERGEEILRRLRYPNEFIHDVCEMVAHHMQFMHTRDMRRARLKRFMARPTFPLELELHRLDCKASNGLTDIYDFLQQRDHEFKAEPLIPPPLITGRDLLERGWPQGEQIGKILEEIQNRQLEGQLQTREQALATLDKEFPPPKKS